MSVWTAEFWLYYISGWPNTIYSIFRMQINLYARDWVIWLSLAPESLRCSGMVRSIRLLSLGFSLPCLANLSAASFPGLPEWPLTHLRKVGALCARILANKACNSRPFSVPIQPQLSQHSQYLLRPSSTVLESFTSINLASLGKLSIASFIAMISSVWFVWVSSPGILMLLFLGSSILKKIPAPASASASSLLMHDPLV